MVVLLSYCDLCQLQNLKPLSLNTDFQCDVYPFRFIVFLNCCFLVVVIWFLVRSLRICLL